LNWSKWVRVGHRWLSIVFTAAVLANLTAVAFGRQEVWIGLMALFPLVLLMISGLYMFVLPHAARWRGGQGAGAGE